MFGGQLLFVPKYHKKGSGSTPFVKIILLKIIFIIGCAHCLSHNSTIKGRAVDNIHNSVWTVFIRQKKLIGKYCVSEFNLVYQNACFDPHNSLHLLQSCYIMSESVFYLRNTCNKYFPAITSAMLCLQEKSELESD